MDKKLKSKIYHYLPFKMKLLNVQHHKYEYFNKESNFITYSATIQVDKEIFFFFRESQLYHFEMRGTFLKGLESFSVIKQKLPFIHLYIFSENNTLIKKIYQNKLYEINHKNSQF